MRKTMCRSALAMTGVESLAVQHNRSPKEDGG